MTADWLRRGGLIVSCQARPDNPLHGPGFMAAVAPGAAQPGAGAVRGGGAGDRGAMRAAVDLPGLTEALQAQACAHEEQQGQGDLGDDAEIHANCVLDRAVVGARMGAA